VVRLDGLKTTVATPLPFVDALAVHTTPVPSLTENETAAPATNADPDVTVALSS